MIATTLNHMCTKLVMNMQYTYSFFPKQVYLWGFYLRKKKTGHAGGRAGLGWARIWPCWARWAGLGWVALASSAGWVGWAWCWVTRAQRGRDDLARFSTSELRSLFVWKKPLNHPAPVFGNVLFVVAALLWR